MLLNVTLLCCFYSHGKKTKQYDFLVPPVSCSFGPESFSESIFFFCHLIPSSSCFPACHCLYFDKNTSLRHLFIIQIDFKCEELLCTLSGRVNFCQNKRDRMDMHTSSVLSPQGILCDKGRLAISNNHKDGL